MTMADRRHDYEPHARTWNYFVRGSVALVLASAYVMVGLVSIAFGSTWPLFLGFLIIVVGHIVIAIDLRAGSRSWGLSLGVLAAFALITIINIY